MLYQRYIYLSFLFGALCLGLAIKSMAVAAITLAGQSDQMIAGLLPLSTIIAITSSVVAMIVALRNQQAVKFTNDIIAELYKVTWPTREETLNNTTIVLISTLVLASMLALFDLGWGKITGLFLYSAG